MNHVNNELNLDWLSDHKSPCFLVDPSSIVVLDKPFNFYTKLKENISKSKRRIVLSSLYLGTGHLEQQLVDAIQKNLDENSETQVKILLDHNRGQRGNISSKTILLPLIRNFSNRFNLYLYHTPKLRGLIKKITPERTNETIGVQHMKIYITDNDMIISGANLSNDYFDNRQDRYILIKNCEDLCDFFESLIDSVACFSFKVDKAGNTVYSNSANLEIHPVLGNKSQFGTELGNKVNNLLDEYKRINELKNRSKEIEEPAYVYPLIQMSDAFINIDEKVTNNFFRIANENSKIYLAVGYFNLTDDYIQTIVNKSSAQFDFLLSSPEANGFFGAKGFSKYIPNIYSYLEEDFLKFCQKQKQTNRVSLFEYKKPDWTFHAKGLWYYPDYKKTNLPSATIIGSSNFGYRSVHRDLEANLLIYSKNQEFQEQLHQEQKNLFENTLKVDLQVFLNEARIAPFWLKIMTKSFRSFF